MRREYLERAAEGLACLASRALYLGLRFTLENLAAPQEVPRTPEEMALFLEVPHLEFCLDLGHAQMAGQEVVGFAQVLGKRLSHVHAHRNDGRYDLHLPPGPEDLRPFASSPCTVLVELPPRNPGEYVDVHESLAATGILPEAKGGG
jgi:sugar phosphate isomerase/epimerase